MYGAEDPAEAIDSIREKAEAAFKAEPTNISRIDTNNEDF